jgi:hypothetical protein
MSRTILLESGGVKIEQTDSDAATTAALPSHLFEDLDLGPLSASGLLVIGTAISGANAPITAVTVNGNAATLVTSVGSGSRFAALHQIAGQGGIGDIEVAVSNTATRWLIGLYKLRGLHSFTAHDFDDDSAGSLSFDVLARGAAIAFHLGDGNPTDPPTISGLTRDFSTSVGAGAGKSTFSGASGVFDAAQTPLAVTITDAASALRSSGVSYR